MVEDLLMIHPLHGHDGEGEKVRTEMGPQSSQRIRQFRRGRRLWDLEVNHEERNGYGKHRVAEKLNPDQWPGLPNRAFSLV